MLTKNYENILAAILASSATTFGQLPVIAVNGCVRFLCGNFTEFPYARTATATTDAGAAGISVGTGGTPADMNNFNLDSTITGGVSLSVTATEAGCEAPGAPFLAYSVTITNTGSEAITIRAIGYKQSVKGAPYPGASTHGSAVCLLDRTVLDTPVTIQPGDAGVIRYMLKVAPVVRSKAGVNLVSFTWGSDADVAAMIDAARNGDIDLQADGGWRVGDVRTIHLDAFTGGNNVSHAAQDLEIVITEFGDYNSCGSLFQFDFAECVTGEQRMAATGTNVGGYAATEMYSVTLPAMAEALPSWLKTRLRTFSVLTGEGNQSTEIEAVRNNKLALRAKVEVFGVSTHSAPGEGSWITFYRSSDDVRKKGTDRSIGLSSGGKNWWMRGPDPASSVKFCSVGGTLVPPNTSSIANALMFIAPFGCV